jgi:hypothetical protein
MRPKIPHPMAERARPRRHRRRPRGALAAMPIAVAAPATVSSCDTSQICDPAVERVQRAGGPVDEAAYACSCGYVFSAAVSTSVSCPNCGADQAW